MNDAQTRSELGIFGRFAEVCPVSIICESIAKQSPPEPDILCTFAGPQEKVAFELVEIIDEGWARLTSGQFRETKSLREAYEASTGEFRRDLDKRMGNALIYISFVADAQVRQRRAAVPELLRRLSTIAPEFSGDWRPSRGTKLHGSVRAVTITRGDFAGPEFDVEAAGSIGDPTLERIRAKWLKTYDTPYPIELLAYYELQPQAPTALWLPSLESFVRDNCRAGPFRRVWVFDIGARIISYESALLESTGRLTAHAPGEAA